MNPEKDIQWSD